MGRRRKKGKSASLLHHSASAKHKRKKGKEGRGEGEEATQEGGGCRYLFPLIPARRREKKRGRGGKKKRRVLPLLWRPVDRRRARWGGKVEEGQEGEKKAHRTWTCLTILERMDMSESHKKKEKGKRERDEKGGGGREGNRRMPTTPSLRCVKSDPLIVGGGVKRKRGGGIY